AYVLRFLLYTHAVLLKYNQSQVFQLVWHLQVLQYLPLIQHMKLFLSRKDRKSTRLNSSHVSISYAVFCLKKKNGSYMSLERWRKRFLIGGPETKTASKNRSSNSIRLIVEPRQTQSPAKTNWCKSILAETT